MARARHGGTRLWVFGVALIAALAHAGTPQKLVVPLYDVDNPKADAYYFIRLLRLALDKTRPEYGDYRLVAPEGYLTDNRLKASLIRGEVDVGWFAGQPQDASRLAPVYDPLLGPINHYRALLIRDGEQDRYADVSTLDDLRDFVGGIGGQWVDADVMRHNRLPHVEVAGYDILFRMLAADRFDYFSRGLYQVKTELQRHPELDLAIEPSLLLHYPNRYYFYVAPGDELLVRRLTLGLERARRDGSRRALLESMPQYRWALGVLDGGGRRVIELEVPPAMEPGASEPEDWPVRADRPGSVSPDPPR